MRRNWSALAHTHLLRIQHLFPSQLHRSFDPCVYQDCCVCACGFCASCSIFGFRTLPISFALLSTITPSQRRQARRKRARARTAIYLHNKGLRCLNSRSLVRSLKILASHHSKDIAFPQSIASTMTDRQPWRCKWCMRLNKASALRCGKCDYQWHLCMDYTFVPGGRGQQQEQQWDYTTWPAMEATSRRRKTKSPRTRRSGTPKSKKSAEKQELYTAPDLDPPWNGKTSMAAQSLTSETLTTSGESQAELKLNRLVAALEKQDAPLDPEIQQLVEEATTKPASSKTMHTAVKKLDQARKKLQSAQTARQNHQNKWSKYLDESIKRWKTFAEEFGKQDGELESRVNQAKEKLQEARQLLDETKEKLSKQDEAFLNEAESISDVEEEQEKMDTSERIQAGITAMVASLESVRVRPPAEEEGSAAKKPRLEEGGGELGTSAPHGSKMLQPFAKAGR